MPPGLMGLHLRKPLFDLVIFAVVIERFFAGPFGAKDVEEFAGPRVALVLVVERVAVLAQFGGIAAGDDVKRDAAAGELVEGRKLARQQRRRGKARPLRNHDLEFPGDAENMLADLKGVRRGRMKRQQRAVETGKLMRLCDRLDVRRIENGAGPHDGLGGVIVRDKSDELDGHDMAPVWERFTGRARGGRRIFGWCRPAGYERARTGRRDSAAAADWFATGHDCPPATAHLQPR